MSEYITIILSLTIMLAVLMFVFLVTLLSKPPRVYHIYQEASSEILPPQPLEKKPLLTSVFEENFGHSQEVYL